MSESKQQSRDIELRHLKENDYNPRRNFDEEAMDALKHSIEEQGLISALTVRPVNGNGDYEVISGTRRLRALEDLYDGDHRVAVNVRDDVDDHQAKLVALAENIEREDLTNMEEARAFADHVTVDVDDETMSYAEYVRDIPRHVGTDPLHKPSKDHPEVKALANSIGRSGSYVKERLSFLTLPDEVQEGIDEGDVPVRKARMLARVDMGGDFELRQKVIRQLHDQYSGRLADSDYQDLRDSINTHEQNYEKMQEITENRVGEFESLVDERREKVQAMVTETVDWLSEEFDNALNVDRDPDDIDKAVEQLTNRLDDIESQVHQDGLEFNEKRDELDHEHTQVKQGLAAFIKHEGDECPYCRRGGLSRDELEENIGKLESRLDSLEEKENHYWSKQGDLRDRRIKLQNAYNSLEQSRGKLEEAREEADDLAGEIYE